MTTMLSIDWDYVTSDCSFLGHSCCGWCKRLPRACGRGDAVEYQPKFSAWRKRLAVVYGLKVKRNAPIVVAECHADIMVPIKRGKYEGELCIYDFDAHCDSYDCGRLCCGSWINYAERVGPTVTIGPPVVDQIGMADVVFLCRSSPWTPAEMDGEFYRLVRRFSEKANRWPRFIGHQLNELREGYRAEVRRVRAA